MQELAFEVAFSSSEMSMRSLALRARLTRLTAFSFDVEDVKGDREQSRMPATVTYAAGVADIQSGVLYISSYPFKTAAESRGTVSAHGLSVIVDGSQLVYPSCSGTMRLDDSGTLVGTLTCNVDSITRPTVKARARLF
jgi:hypothetical protein